MNANPGDEIVLLAGDELLVVATSDRLIALEALNRGATLPAQATESPS